MNTIHNNGENDQNLNDGLEKLGQAYERLEQDEPPDLLDQAILNSAHRAVEKKSGWQQIGWMHGLATSAVIVLAFSIIFDQGELAPELKEDVLRNTPSLLESRTEFKKQSADQLGESVMEEESSTEVRQKISMGDAPATATKPKELSSESSRAQPMREVQSELRVQGAAIGKSEYADRDDSTVEALQEGVLMDEADVLTKSPPVDTASRQVMPNSVATPQISAMKARGRTELSIEQELQGIIELKKSGDEAWITELAAFIERFPDYQLPDELKN
jgi:hypothetical protein